MKKFTLFILIAFIVFVLPPKALAQEKINSFDVLITAHKDGSMSVLETIKYDFGQNSKHGIFRDIPLVSKVGDLYRVISLNFNEIKRDGLDEEYKIDQGAKMTQVKIGNPDKTISGVHTYDINYRVENGIGSNFEDHDEIFWNVTGHNWEIPIIEASITIKTDFGVTPEKTICFTGSFGATESNCEVSELDGMKKVVANTLNPSEGFTIVTSFPVSTFPKSLLQKREPFTDPDFLSILKLYGFIALGLNFFLGPYLLFWLNKHKNKTRFGPPSVNFDIPSITPAEAGIIDNTKLEKDDVVATIFDLAIRKYIKIEEIKNVRALRPDEIDYKIIKLKDYEDLNTFETELLSRFFSSGDEILLSKLKKDFYLTFSAMDTEIFQLLKTKKFYTKNPKLQMGGLMVLGVIATAGLNLILGPVLIYLSRKLNGRTQLGDKIDWQIDGLKIFLKAMSRHHKWQAKNLITVEKYIPYAIALGLQDEFMEQLKIIYPNYKPDWYSGSGNFYMGYHGIYSGVSSNVTTSAPSSSSGFSGGSSGGGGGGGGGGSW